jgi:hypothetical protein
MKDILLWSLAFVSSVALILAAFAIVLGAMYG